MHILLDFDGTITQDDTIDVLGNVAVAFQKKRQQDATMAAVSDNWADCWTAIVETYMADLTAHMAAYAPAEADRTTLEEEFTYLRSLRDVVDMPSIRRVRDSRIFAGLTADHLVQAGAEAVVAAEKGIHAIHLRAGFDKLLQEATEHRGWPVSIVSVNWSDAWIRGVVGNSSSNSSNSNIRVFANEVTHGGDVVPNFERGGSRDSEPLASCADKLEAMEVAVAMAGAADKDEDQIVYIGDSTTDLECLIGASAGGIIMASHGPESSSALRTLARLHYDVPHVSKAPKMGRARDKGDGPRLAWAADFGEILSSGIFDV